MQQAAAAVGSGIAFSSAEISIVVGPARMSCLDDAVVSRRIAANQHNDRYQGVSGPQDQVFNFPELMSAYEGTADY